MNQPESPAIETLKKDIQALRVEQKNYSFGHRSQNASKFGAYERRIAALWANVDRLRQQQTA